MRDHEGDDLEGPQAHARDERRRDLGRSRRARRRVRLTERATDPVAVAALGRELAGIEYVRRIFAGELPAPPIADLVGFRGVEASAGFAAFEMTPGPQHYNPIGSVHGGVALTLLDSAMGCAVHTLLEAGVGYTTLEVKANFVRPITADTGLIRCEGTVVHAGSKVATAEGRLLDGAGKLLAHGTTTCLIFR